MTSVIETQGIAFAKLGLGTYRLQGDACRKAVESALALGYRHIDTAEMYGNEEAVGAALAKSGVPRGEIHVKARSLDQRAPPDRSSLRAPGLDKASKSRH